MVAVNFNFPVFTLFVVIVIILNYGLRITDQSLFSVCLSKTTLEHCLLEH